LVTLPVILIACYSMSRHSEPVPSIGALGASLALVTAAIALDGAGVSDFGFGWFLVSGPWMGGHLVRRHAAAAAASEEEAREVAEAARQRVAQAAADERSRIARELHDIVSHSLTAMVVQATAAEHLADADPENAKASMRQVQATGREAMDEMKHLLGLLRAPEGPQRGPQPALDDLTGLVEDARAAGAEVSLRVTGVPRKLPRGMALSVYRIAQEALTNVRKHAGNADTEVHLQFGATSLCLEVVDDGPQPSRATAAPGYGLTGMRERAALYDGRIEATPRTDGHGWRVRAEFPLATS
jgi:signal transduction histidine kinase